jgi:hypothetical protein
MWQNSFNDVVSGELYFSGLTMPCGAPIPQNIITAYNSALSTYTTYVAGGGSPSDTTWQT